ncbi:hypothetical protein GX48_04118 [Paracoccidioides brasiliensis]|nr:hypothetical protein GX48_04118 [Paracoccidioides brasiliensis]
MSLNKIEVLPTSSSHITPGWAYVPDTRYGASTSTGRAAGGRTRAVRELGGAGRADVSSRQNTATLRHLTELDRENHKDTHIPIPTKQKAATAKDKPRGKTTSNVRRILMSQKTFKNYLDDEEAALAQGHSQALATITSSIAATSTTATPGRSALKSSKSSTPHTSSRPATPKKSTPATANQSPEPLNAASSQVSTSTSHQQQRKQQLIVSNYDNDPLLRSYIPSAPSEKLMQQLLAEPPLSYNASRATHATTTLPGRTAGPTKPPRHFCSICGYWGRVKCIKCRTRVCGLECYRIHEETRCDRFYA